MKTYTKHIFAIFTLMLFGIIPQAQAQFSVGAGVSTMKFLGSGSEKPRAFGVDLQLGIDISKKATVIIAPAFYVPIKYEYNSTFNLNNVPTITKNDEKINIFRTSVLLQYMLVGDNTSSNLYVMAGPGMVFYNAKVNRHNAQNGEDMPSYNVSTKFNDVVLDARVGGTLSFGNVGIYLETGIAPTVVSNLKDIPNYKPERGAQWTANLGVRFHFVN